MRAKELLRL